MDHRTEWLSKKKGQLCASWEDANKIMMINILYSKQRIQKAGSTGFGEMHSAVSPLLGEPFERWSHLQYGILSVGE